jgi:hypothetical protein
MFAGIDLPALGYRVSERQATDTSPHTSFSAGRRPPLTIELYEHPFASNAQS